MRIDILIVGQGLAGSLLAWELMRRQYRVLVIDSGGENASQVAAGLINPVTGQRLVKASDVETILPIAMDCYRQLALAFNRQFFVPLTMLRIFKNAKEQEVARRRLSELGYQAFFQDRTAGESGVLSPYGLLEQTQTGYLRTRLLLDTLRDYLIANAGYRQARLDYDDIVLQPQLQWQGIQTSHIVFCEGYEALANPWFGKLPFQPAKGEILGCATAGACPQRILNFGYWLIPSGENHVRIGATFDSGKTDTRPTEQARERLLKEVLGVYPALKILEVSTHQAGVRPATLDKHPFVGNHPRYPNLHIFNGFGAKGSLSIPWHARRFADALKLHTPLPARCSIRRYDSTYFPG